MSKKFNFVYKTTDLSNGKEYIGSHSTNNINDHYLGSGRFLLKMIKKHGKEKFQREKFQIPKVNYSTFDLLFMPCALPLTYLSLMPYAL